MKIRILIVDDDQSILDQLKNLFTDSKYEVETALDPLKVLKMLELKNYHIVITDIDMPGINGVDLIKEIKGYNGLIQIIAITEPITSSILLDALRRGAYDFYFKPFLDINKVLQGVESIVSRVEKWNDQMIDLENELNKNKSA